MKDLSLHILDIVQNSISAQAKNILISIHEDLRADTLTIVIKDDGVGMSSDVVKKVIDPYYTSRTTRKVGLGLPLFKQNAQASGGSFTISSTQGEGTEVKAIFSYSHIDRPPIGDMPGVIMILVGSNPELEFRYEHIRGENEYVFDTIEVKEVLDDLPLNDPTVIRHLKEMIRENLKDLKA